MSDPSSNLGLIRATYDAFSQGDVPGVLGVMDADIVWHEAEGFPYGGTYHGPDAVLNHVFVKLATEWADFQATPDEYVDGGDTIVALGHYTGTYNATDRGMRVPFAHMWKLRDGKAVEFRQYTDTLLVDRVVEGAE